MEQKTEASQAVDERPLFEKTMNDMRFFPRELDFTMTKSPSGRDEYANAHLQSCWVGWSARAGLKAQPAPTEATAEPVMWFEAEASAKGQPLRHVIGSMLYSTRMHTTKPEVLNNALWPLYEHPAPTEAPKWSDQPPTAQADYWHWNGNDDAAPSLVSVLYSPSGYFVASMSSHSGQAEMCHSYGGWWMRIEQPGLPGEDVTAEAAEQVHAPAARMAECKTFLAQLSGNSGELHPSGNTGELAQGWDVDDLISDMDINEEVAGMRAELQASSTIIPSILAAQGEDSARLDWLIENVSSGSIGFINGDFIGSQDFDELKVYIDRARASAETGGVKP